MRLFLMEENPKVAIAILIPTYNCVDYLAGCLDSVLAQTFEHYKVVLFDDNSTDGTNIICRDYCMYHPDKIQGGENWGQQMWNGGSRNHLLHEMKQLGINAEYVLFMDGDDKFVDNTVLQRVWDFTLEQGCPDVTRLSYTKKNPDGKIITKIIKDTTPAEMAHNTKVAPWTKLVKRKLLEQVEFPENTLFEDVTHHLALSDIVETVASTDFPVIEWNRCNPHSTSTAISPKRMSSAFRFVADLMDLKLTKEYTEERRAVKILDACNNLGIDFDQIDWKKVCC
jgi:glycosyltransferase involved in cell wall biosynthesis